MFWLPRSQPMHRVLVIQQINILLWWYGWCVSSLKWSVQVSWWGQSEGVTGNTPYRWYWLAFDGNRDGGLLHEQRDILETLFYTDFFFLPHLFKKPHRMWRLWCCSHRTCCCYVRGITAAHKFSHVHPHRFIDLTDIDGWIHQSRQGRRKRWWFRLFLLYNLCERKTLNIRSNSSTEED